MNVLITIKGKNKKLCETFHEVVYCTVDMYREIRIAWKTIFDDLEMETITFDKDDVIEIKGF